MEPGAVIWSAGKKLTKGFRWEDFPIGSLMNPVYMSQTSIL
jgi:hypothetical protein